METDYRDSWFEDSIRKELYGSYYSLIGLSFWPEHTIHEIKMNCKSVLTETKLMNQTLVQECGLSISLGKSQVQ